MYSVIYMLYYYLKRIESRNKRNKKINSRLLQKMLDYSEWFFNLPVKCWYSRFRSHRCGVNSKPRKERIIVSLTSYPERIETLWIALETLLRQSMKPDEIILWVASDQFTNNDELPNTITRLQERGVSIRFCDDLRSHKKYFYALQEYSKNLVILVDDDFFYPRDMVKKLYKLHLKYPNDIICMTPAIITSVDDPPSVWGRPDPTQRLWHCSDIQPFTGSGTLYPPNSVDCKYTFREDLIKKLCPYADDLWLAYMALRNNTYCSAVYKCRSFPVSIYATSENSLWHVNGAGGMNDVQWSQIRSFFMGNDETV